MIDLNDYSKTAAQHGWGAGWPSCAAAQLAGLAVATAPRSGVGVSVHRRIARLVALLFAETERRGYLLRPGQCWGYACRAIRRCTDTPTRERDAVTTASPPVRAPPHDGHPAPQPCCAAVFE